MRIISESGRSRKPPLTAILPKNTTCRQAHPSQPAGAFGRTFRTPPFSSRMPSDRSLCGAVCGTLGMATPVSRVGTGLLKLRSPTARAIRQQRTEAGERLFTVKEVRARLAKTQPQLQARMLLRIDLAFLAMIDKGMPRMMNQL